MENLSTLGYWLSFSPEARNHRSETYKNMTPDVHVLLDFVQEHGPQYLSYTDCTTRRDQPDVLAWSREFPSSSAVRLALCYLSDHLPMPPSYTEIIRCLT